MARLRRVSPQMKGWTRRRAGKGFAYLDADGDRLPAEEVERIRSLAIPPAWRDVWICPYPNGHIQALGTDDAGRRQYLYHPDWRTKRDQLKFDRVKVAGHPPGPGPRADDRGPPGRGDAALARRRDRHPAARPRLLPDRQRRLRRRQRLVRPHHARAAARPAGQRRPRLQLRRQVGHRALDHDQRPARHRLAQPHAPAPRGLGPAARVPRRGAVGRPRRVGGQRLHQPDGRTRTSPPRTSAPGTPPCSRPWRWPRARRRATPRPRRSGRSRRPSRRSRPTSATPRRSPASPTSTRGSSTSTSRASPSRRPCAKRYRDDAEAPGRHREGRRPPHRQRRLTALAAALAGTGRFTIAPERFRAQVKVPASGGNVVAAGRRRRRR